MGNFEKSRILAHILEGFGVMTSKWDEISSGPPDTPKTTFLRDSASDELSDLYVYSTKKVDINK